MNIRVILNGALRSDTKSQPIGDFFVGADLCVRPWLRVHTQVSPYNYSVCQKFFPLIPSPPGWGRGLG